MPDKKIQNIFKIEHFEEEDRIKKDFYGRQIIMFLCIYAHGQCLI